MMTIYHNPRCSKSREGLQLIELQHNTFKIVKYLNEPFTKKDLADLIVKLKISPLQLVRQNETIWKENYKGKQLTDDEVIEAMITHSVLIERPIVVNGDKAVIARPTQKINEIL